MKYDYQEPLEYILKLIVNNPEDLEVTQKEDGTVVDLYVKANKEDYGIIIGKKGDRIKNIKKILTVKAVKDGVKLNIKVDDDNMGRKEEVVESKAVEVSEETEDFSTEEMEKE